MAAMTPTMVAGGMRSRAENRAGLVAICLILAGSGLRLISYALNRSLWVDEALLALNIVKQPWGMLLRAVPVNDQVAPPGFLVLDRGMVALIGPNEWAVRSIPLLAGVAGMILFWRLAQRVLRPSGALMALGLFVLSEPLVRYSFEVKPYEVDALVSTVILLTFVKVLDTNFHWRVVATYAALAMVAPWFSYPSTLVLGGCGMVLLVTSFRQGKGLVGLLLVACAGLLSGGLLYLVAMRPALSHQGLAEFWNETYPPLPVSFSALRWYYGAVRILFEYALGAIPGVPILACIVGIASFYIRHRRFWWAMLATVLLTLAASGLHFYPFYNRLLLFLFPIVLLLIGEGFVAVLASSPARGLAVALGVLLLVDPIVHAFYNLGSMYRGEEIRPVMAWLREHRQAGDLIYTVDSTKYAFDFYRDRFGFNDANILLGGCAFEGMRSCADFDRVRTYHRVWVLYSRGDPKTTGFVLSSFGQLGREGTSFRTGHAAVWLFERGHRQLDQAPMAPCGSVCF